MEVVKVFPQHFTVWRDLAHGALSGEPETSVAGSLVGFDDGNAVRESIFFITARHSHGQWTPALIDVRKDDHHDRARMKSRTLCT